MPSSTVASSEFQEARRTEAGGDSGRCAEGAATTVDNAMVKALARAFRWRKMLDEGVHTTLEDLARARGVAPSYVSRVLRLTLLAPEIVVAILGGRQPAGMHLAIYCMGFRWSESPNVPIARLNGLPAAP